MLSSRLNDDIGCLDYTGIIDVRSDIEGLIVFRHDGVPFFMLNVQVIV